MAELAGCAEESVARKRGRSGSASASSRPDRSCDQQQNQRRAASHTDGRARATRERQLTVPPDRLSTTLGLRVLGERPTVSSRPTLVDARTDLPASARSRATVAYGVVNLFARYDINDRIRADVVVQKALDKRYRPYPEARASRPRPHSASPSPRSSGRRGLDRGAGAVRYRAPRWRSPSISRALRLSSRER
jgi:outer membrane receptor protein involved in Fe transport